MPVRPPRRHVFKAGVCRRTARPLPAPPIKCAQTEPTAPSVSVLVSPVPPHKSVSGACASRATARLRRVRTLRVASKGSAPMWPVEASPVLPGNTAVEAVACRTIAWTACSVLPRRMSTAAGLCARSVSTPGCVWLAMIACRGRASLAAARLAVMPWIVRRASPASAVCAEHAPTPLSAVRVMDVSMAVFALPVSRRRTVLPASLVSRRGAVAPAPRLPIALGAGSAFKGAVRLTRAPSTTAGAAPTRCARSARGRSSAGVGLASLVTAAFVTTSTSARS